MDTLDNQVKADMLGGGGEMGALMRSFDWSATPVGPVERWPQSLRTTVGILLASVYPMYIAWGPDYVQFYNDAYRPILGATKHPALGQSTRECFAEIWDIIGSMFERVMTSGEATWREDQLLPLDRYGYVEECYFTFSYSAIRDETGGVGGVFVTVIETTARVLGERRLRTLRDLAGHTADARTAEAACTMAADILAGNLADLPFALLYLLDADRARLAGVAGLEPGQPASPLSIELADAAHQTWPLAGVVRSGATTLVDGLAARFGQLPGGAWPDAPQRALVLPIAAPGQERPAGFLVAGISPRRALDDSYRGFLELVAGQVATSITEARAYEAERRRAEMLAELDRAKTTFFSNVSHEFRTPLTLLLGLLEEALADPDSATAEQHERLEIAHRNGLRLLKLVNTLLDFSRIEAGRAQALYAPTDLAALTHDLASVFRAAIERAGLRLVVDCPPLPEPVYVDREMWEKIILNLLSNAFKFTFAGEIGVTLRQDDGQVELVVRDTGSGIPPEELPHLFKRFHRVRETRSRTHEGTGIGLSLVQELVHLHGGSVSAVSTVGEGTAFTVRIPTGTAHLPAEQVGAPRDPAALDLDAAPYIEEALRWLPSPTTDDRRPTTDGFEDRGWRMEDGSVDASEKRSSIFDPPSSTGSVVSGQARARILLADDNADMRDYLARLLGRQYRVEAVADGAAALAAARAHPPDLVLADVMMPELDGFGLLRALRADPRTSAIPILLLSARAGEESAVEGLQAGADDYLVKPFSARDLLARISARLELVRLRQALTEQQRFLSEASTLLTSSLDYEMTLATLARLIVPTLADWCAVDILDQDGQIRRLAVEHVDPAKVAWGHELQQRYPFDPNGPRGVPHVLRTGASELYAEIPDALLVEAARDDEHLQIMRLIGFSSVMIVPLLAHGSTLGALTFVAAESGRHYDHGDLALAEELAHRAALAIDNSRLYHEAQVAIRLRDQFLSIAAHELKTPLTSLLGYSQALERRSLRAGTLNDRDLRTLRVISEQARRLNRLIESLLDIGRIQAGRFELERRPVDLRALAQRLAEELQPSLEQHTLHLESGEEPLIVVGDELRLEQVVQNLLQNAVKYSPAGGPITLRAERREDNACLMVSDRGIGIPAAALPQLFQRFYRADNVNRHQISGMGIGLFVVKEIVSLHGGAVAATSIEGEGSTFTIHIPLLEKEKRGS